MRTSAAVVGTLGTGETALGPAVWSAISVFQHVLLLEAEPGLQVLSEFHDLGGMVAVVGFVGSAVVVVALGEDEDVIAATEGILEDGSRPQIDIGVATGSLVGGRTVEVPNTQLTDVGNFVVNGLRQWSDDTSTGRRE